MTREEYNEKIEQKISEINSMFEDLESDCMVSYETSDKDINAMLNRIDSDMESIKRDLSYLSDLRDDLEELQCFEYEVENTEDENCED